MGTIQTYNKEEQCKNTNNREQYNYTTNRNNTTIQQTGTIQKY
jgi:hypothetical protein